MGLFRNLFRSRKRESKRERGHGMGAAVSTYMDEVETYSWEWRKARDEIGEEAASAKYPTRYTTAGIVETLLPMCDNNLSLVQEALGVWQESRSRRCEAEGDEDRSTHVTGVFMSVGLNGIGNLFGLIPASAPSFDPDLAAQGRARGWRR